jgi:hypothetical protein
MMKIINARLLYIKAATGNILINRIQYIEENLPETVQNLNESTLVVKGNSLFGQRVLPPQICFQVQQFSG